MEETKKQWFDLVNNIRSNSEELGIEIPLKNTRVRCIETGTIYSSLSQAAKDTGCSKSHVSSVCNGILKTAKGLRFEFIDEDDIDVRNLKKQQVGKTKKVKRKTKPQTFSKEKRHESVDWVNQKSVYCYNTSKSYKSISEASRDTGCSTTIIRRVCKDNLNVENVKDLKSTKGFTFIFD